MGVTLQMANEIRVGLGVTGEQKAQKALKDTGNAAEKAGDQLEEMGDQATAAGKSSEQAGDDFRDAADDAGHLKREVDRLTSSYKDLLRQFNETGDTSLLKDIRREKRSLGQFQRLAKDLFPDIAPAAAKTGLSFGEAFATNAATAITRGGPYVTGAILGIGLSAAPLLGATVSAAILGGVGAGGIIGGIALAASDPRVSSVAESVGTQLTEDFQRAAGGFVDPLIRSLAKVGSAGWADKLEPAFDSLSGRVDSLTDGLIGLVDKGIPGLVSASEAGGELIDLFAKEAPEVGEAIGEMLRIISEDPQGAKDALQFLLNLVEKTAIATGYLVSGLSQVYAAANDVSEALGLIDRTDVEPTLTRGAGAINEFGHAAEDAEAAVTALDLATKKLLDQAFGLEAAQDNAADGFARLTEQIKRQKEEGDKGAGSLEGNTQAARDNRDMMRDLIADYQQIIVETTKAGGKTDHLRQQFINNAVAAGIARKEAEKYATALFGIPTNIKVSIAATIKAHGDMVAWSMFRAQERKDAEAAGKRASGGPVSAGKTYWVGENGPELVTMGADGYVHNAAQSQAMVSGASGGMSMVSAGGGAVQVVVSAAGTSDRLLAAIVDALQFEVRTTANGSAQEFFGTTSGG